MIPCEECITLALCKHKGFGELIHDCSKLADLLYYPESPKSFYVLGKRRQETFTDFMYELRRIMKPTSWDIKSRYTKRPTIDIISTVGE